MEPCKEPMAVEAAPAPQQDANGASVEPIRPAAAAAVAQVDDFERRWQQFHSLGGHR
jgi:hypothetical protein